MVSLLIQNGLITNPLTKPTNNSSLRKKPIINFHSQKPKYKTPFNLIKKILHPTLKYYLNSNDLPSKIVYFDEKNSIIEHNKKNKMMVIEEVENEEVIIEGKKVKKNNSKKKMLILCGVGYWVQGFRCFPWLALNFHMANNLNFDPSTLQLVQYSSFLPMVAKPFYGILFDAINIGGFHRIPYVSIGVLLQVCSWGPLAILPFVGDGFPTLMACVLLSNLGAAITEVAQDALVAEYGQKHKMIGLQSYTFMAIAIAGVVGNLVGGVLLSRTHPRSVLFIFSLLLSFQLLVTLSTKEESLGLSKPASSSSLGVKQDSLLSSIKRRFSELLTALSGKKISQPLIWAVGSIAVVPMLTGSIFCFQTQSLNLDPSIIGMSKVIGQMLLLSLTVLYDRFWKNIPFRQLMTRVQIFYAASLLLDFVLVKQINLRIGIPNDVYVLCFSGLAETAAIFKTVPFFVLIGSLCPPGCEAPVNAFLASALTLSTIGSGFSGIGLASVLGISSENYSNLPFGIIFQFLVALVPLFWINNLPLAFPAFNKDKSKSRRKRIRRTRRNGRVTPNNFFTYGRGKESEKQN